MNEVFDMSSWWRDTQMIEYSMKDFNVATPVSREEIGEMWDSCQRFTDIRADIISQADPRAEIKSKDQSWENINPQLQGEIVGYFNRQPKEYYYYLGIIQTR